MILEKVAHRVMSRLLNLGAFRYLVVLIFLFGGWLVDRFGAQPRQEEDDRRWRGRCDCKAIADAREVFPSAS